MRRAKSLFVAIIIMLLVSMVSLYVVSVLTYIFKWHADKAMIGIIATYVLAGFLGGFCLSRYEKRRLEIYMSKGVGQKAVETLMLSGIFMLVLVGISILGMKNAFEISARFFVVFILLVCSAFLGRIL